MLSLKATFHIYFASIYLHRPQTGKLSTVYRKHLLYELALLNIQKQKQSNNNNLFKSKQKHIAYSLKNCLSGKKTKSLKKIPEGNKQSPNHSEKFLNYFKAIT